MPRLDLKARAKSAKTISTPGRRRRENACRRTPRSLGFAEADEGVEGVFGSRAEMDACRRQPEKPFYVSTAHDLEALTHTFDAFDEILPILA